jgi:hypothetical protein
MGTYAEAKEEVAAATSATRSAIDILKQLQQVASLAVINFVTRLVTCRKSQDRQKPWCKK